MMGWFLTLLSCRLAMLWTLNPRVSFGGSAPVSWLSTKSMTLISAYDCLGQAVQYGKELLRLCPARQQAVTILFNLRTVRMVVVSRRASSSSLHVEASNTVAMDTSGPSFIWSAAVTAHSSSTLPWSLAKALGAPDKERRTGKMHGDYCFMVSLSMGVLGSGATSRVLHAS
ncbi:hypothetical protein BASA81_012627 [Batrachochytrium salamandrivorans]|nr:hypothetical protein BASA81_012627 [Batrachochytrium salamandrivorans]